jgi:FkbH-like protein
MYESESNMIVGSERELPEDILARFAESRKAVAKRTMIPWGEHCTECVWPTCYSTCDLYQPRFDGRCRRFVEGMVRIEHPESVNSYLLKITFKRWAKLWSVGNTRLYALPQADRLEHRDQWLAGGIQLFPVRALRAQAMRKRYSWKKRMARRPARSSEAPNCMLMECYNPGGVAVSMTLTVRGNPGEIPFQSLLLMQPGFNRHRIGMGEIEKFIDISSRFDVELAPNEVADTCTLFFGAMDFVIDTAYAAPPQTVASQPEASSQTSRLCKCVVWDLDNTLWDGTLIEDGREKLRLKPSIPEILKTLDERGILISAVSKNSAEDALAVLRDFGIADYFLFPQISWNPKSQGVQQVARSLNIGLDSLLFVDDSLFEREEVKSVCPDLVVLDAVDYQTIPTRPDCQTPVTDESRKRRMLYREQQVRDTVQRKFEGDYFAFLRDCHLQLTVQPLTETNLERVHELTQRTNQMNFSGNRYSRSQLHELLRDHETDTYVLDCKDRFGAYGIIGFCTVQRQQNCMTDLMFSCRIQAKRVEHAFISYILHSYRRPGTTDFFVNYRKTKKNAGPGQVFADFGFVTLGESDGVTRLTFPQDKEIPDDQIIAITDLTKLTRLAT